MGPIIRAQDPPRLEFFLHQRSALVRSLQLQEVHILGLNLVPSFNVYSPGNGRNYLGCLSLHLSWL